LQTASGQAVNDRSNRDAGGSPPRRSGARRFLGPTALIIAALLTILSFGAMVVALRALYPSEPAPASAAIECEPTQEYAEGLKVANAGQPRQEADKVIVRVKVTNEVFKAPPVQGTPGPAEPTPAPEAANLMYGFVKVFLYNEVDGRTEIVGSGVGNVDALKHGESKEIDVPVTPVENFSESTKVIVCPDTVWTDKDPAPKGNDDDTDKGVEPAPAVPSPVP
jgi:hypothetical protein